jgi:hypothetical protein
VKGLIFAFREHTYPLQFVIPALVSVLRDIDCALPDFISALRNLFFTLQNLIHATGSH